jgi:outer membrane protein assembly factor BamB
MCAAILARRAVTHNHFCPCQACRAFYAATNKVFGKSMKRIITITSGFAFVALLTSASAQDWPQWRGANRDAKVTGFDAPKTWPEQLHQQWKVDVGNADATPALVGNDLFVFSREETDEVTQCLDAATGKQIWIDRYTAKPATGPAGGHPGPRSSPTVGEGKVVTLGVRGVVSCLNASDGKVVWRKNDYPGYPTFFTSMSPIIVNGLAVVHVGGDTNGAVVAYDLNSGDKKWQWTGDGPAYDSPVLVKLGDLQLVILQTAKKIVALNTADGTLAWSADIAPKGMYVNSSTPIIDGQTLIYATAKQGTVAVKLDKQGGTVTATPLWSNPDLSPKFCSPVLKDGLLYGMTQRGAVYCINAQTGKTDWVQSEPIGNGFGSIIDAGSVLMALTPKSQLLVFSPSDKEYSQIASIKVADGPTYSYPVVAGKRIFIEDQQSVTLWTLE